MIFLDGEEMSLIVGEGRKAYRQRGCGQRQELLVQPHLTINKQATVGVGIGVDLGGERSTERKWRTQCFQQSQIEAF